MTRAARPHVPGDPGVCRSPAAAAFDPVAAVDPRQVIAWADALVTAATEKPPSVCRVSER
ncbi:MAG: hypothetical protein IT293_08460 [Deltaproteobacteria bacterium]|nr:hypothetical protein [Deltaproteobacteria bacterium]